MYMFPVHLVDWAHRWRAASAAQSWSVVLAPGRDNIHCSGCEELFKEHLKITNPCQGREQMNLGGYSKYKGFFGRNYLYVSIRWVGRENWCSWLFRVRGPVMGAEEEKPQWGKYGGITQAACPCMVLYNMVRWATRRRSCNDLQWRSFRRAVTLVFHLFWPVTKLAALRCTASKRWMWLVWKGSQTQLAYSSDGRTSVLYASSLVFSEHSYKLRRISFRVLWDFDTVWLMWYSQFRSLPLVSSTPRYGLWVVGHMPEPLAPNGVPVLWSP